MVDHLALDTDFYQITMAQVYHDRSMDGMATFSLFAHNLPDTRGFMVAAGLEYVLDYLEGFAFSAREIEYLASLGRFSAGFLASLDGLSFTGDVWAAPEGTVLFAGEPFLEVTAPITQAQLVETHLIRTINLHSTLSSKAARCILAAGGRECVDFSLRRCQGRDAGLAAARAAVLSGFSSTSNVDAARRLGVAPVGTMAHSFVEAFGDERQAFEAFADSFPDYTVTLVDTYDNTRGLEDSVHLARRLHESGHRLLGIRLDSGDLAVLSRQARQTLDAAGLRDVKVVVSGSLDEERIAALLAADAAVDIFAVGTRMGSSADAPYLDLAYKLVAYDERPTLKLSSGKQTHPGAKQVWRELDEGGIITGDVLGLRDERHPGRALLEPVMEGGRRLGPRQGWRQAGERFAAEAKSLPTTCRDIARPSPLQPTVSPLLEDLTRKATRDALARQAG